MIWYVYLQHHEASSQMVSDAYVCQVTHKHKSLVPNGESRNIVPSRRGLRDTIEPDEFGNRIKQRHRDWNGIPGVISSTAKSNPVSRVHRIVMNVMKGVKFSLIHGNVFKVSRSLTKFDETDQHCPCNWLSTESCCANYRSRVDQINAWHIYIH